MTLFLLIGLTLLSWWTVLIPLMIIGGVAAFAWALMAPEKKAAPARSRREHVVEKDDLAAKRPVPSTIPAPRREDRERQAA